MICTSKYQLRWVLEIDIKFIVIWPATISMVEISMKIRAFQGWQWKKINSGAHAAVRNDRCPVVVGTTKNCGIHKFLTKRFHMHSTVRNENSWWEFKNVMLYGNWKQNASYTRCILHVCFHHSSPLCAYYIKKNFAGSNFWLRFYLLYSLHHKLAMRRCLEIHGQWTVICHKMLDFELPKTWPHLFLLGLFHSWLLLTFQLGILLWFEWFLGWKSRC